ncbi:MAG: Holliday junction resolvase RuvX [Thermodesulfobacteriota bacterium]
MRIMGLDIGSHTVGIAISDELGITAQGLKTIRRKSMEKDLTEIKTIISVFEIEKIVAGLPKKMDGTLGEGAQKVLQWIEAFKKRIDLPVITWDERLTTVEASRILLEADLSRKKRKRVIDKLAAALILQGYLDYSRKRNDESLLPT